MREGHPSGRGSAPVQGRPRTAAPARGGRGPIRPRRRIPIAVLGAVALVLAAPLLLGSAPVPASAVLEATATPEPPSTGGRADAAALAARPDPEGDASSPAHRSAPPPESLTGYQWPLPKARLTLPFGPSPWGSRIVDGEKVHDGIDLATFCGDKVKAAHAGTVLAAGRHYDAFMGWLGDLTPYTDRLDAKHLWVTLPNVVVIDDGNGYRSMYAHFRSVVVQPGDVVAAGQLLGYEGATGRASGCHLHYGLFSPDEVAVFGFDPVAAAHMLLPTTLIARIDPQLVLPPPEDAGIH